MRTCETEGCAAPHRARGLCSSHYNQRHQPNRHAKVLVDCSWCGRPCAKEPTRGERYDNLFCSYACRDTWRRRDRLPVLYLGTVARIEPRQPKSRPAKRWVAGWCRTCGVAFLDVQPDARSCSARCTRKYWREIYRDDVPRSVRAYIYERDGWRCGICEQVIPSALAVPDYLAATVDHIVPRSEGGTHDVANLRAAHYICNTRRNNRGGNEQLALFG